MRRFNLTACLVMVVIVDTIVRLGTTVYEDACYRAYAERQLAILEHLESIRKAAWEFEGSHPYGSL
jgi:hypothetical protein